jgi:uncharacterized protein
VYEQEVASGLYVDLSNPDPALITIKDIAAHLAGLRRFTGHSPVSVAEHSVIVADMLRDSGASLEIQFAGLMHDAHEAYIGDISRPMKNLLGLSRVRQVENLFDVAICEKYDIRIDDIQCAGIAHFDSLALAIEAHWHMMSAGADGHYSRLPKPTFNQLQKYRPQCLAYEEARLGFLGRYNEFARPFGLTYAM